MAQPRDQGFSPRSTSSSAGPATIARSASEGGPAAGGPEGDVKNACLPDCVDRVPAGTPTVPRPSVIHHGISVSVDKDPFVTPVRGTGLSPTASTFTPFAEDKLGCPMTVPGIISSSLSSDMGLSRVLQMSSEEMVIPDEVEAALVSMESRPGFQFHGTRQLSTSARNVFVKFKDIRDSMRVKDSYCLIHKNHRADFVETHKNARLFEGDMELDATGSTERGQVLVIVTCQMAFNPHETHLWDTLVRILEVHGRLFALVNRVAFSNGVFQAVAEYCSTSAASHAVQAYREGISAMGLRITVKDWCPDFLNSDSELASLFQGLQSPSTNGGESLQHLKVASKNPHATSAHISSTLPIYPFVFSPQFSPGPAYLLDRFPGNAPAVPLGHLSPVTPLSPGYRMMRSMYHSPPSPALTSHHSLSPSRTAPCYMGSEGRRQNATRVTRASHGPGSHHNHVDTTRIREGIDVRTTIMLRNIPNKVDQAMLKRLVDESSWGKYDFMYLRIDFANDCNVGYAFINFVDPLDIVDFVEARGNQRWNCFKSDKVAEISYATIQGKDCLVQKFRNSSVMLEAPHYRPKLYFTSNGPVPELAGQEEPFPEPDNQSKMKRSCENAEHVGLFTPNAGQHFRDEQRRRRSQYDRGTRLAALEEYDYDSSVHHMCGAP